MREHLRNHVTESQSAHELRVGHELDDVREVADWPLFYISKRLASTPPSSMRDCILRAALVAEVDGGGRGDGRTAVRA
jgi:hypothetical protein